MDNATSSGSTDAMHFSLTIAQEALNEGAELMSFWPEVRDDPRLAAAEALDILAIWAQLRRFPPTDIEGHIATDFDRLVNGDSEHLLSRYFEAGSPGQWTDSATRLSRAWDEFQTSAMSEDLERQARDLFDALDRYSLAAHTATTLLPATDERRSLLAAIEREIRECEEFLGQHVDAFYPAASLAAAQLESCRPDLFDVDRALWMTTLKHQLLADIYAEEQVPVTLPRLSDQEKDQLLSAVTDEKVVLPLSAVTSPSAVEAPIVRVRKKTMEDVTDAFRRQFASEKMCALAAASDEKKEVKVWDSKQDLAPFRCIVYQEENGDWRLDFSSTDETDAGQTYEVVVQEQTRPTFTFGHDPQSGELFGEARIPRDELPADLSRVTIRLKKP